MLFLAGIAGPGWAGDAWVADYRIRDARGEHSLVLVREDARVEYRMEGEPPRVWRQTPDGVELLELYPADSRMIAYAPGDLRTLNRLPDWSQLTGMVDPVLRTRLAAAGGAEAFAQPVIRYRGADAQSQPVELDWLNDAGLPFRYCAGKHCDGKRHPATDAIHLQDLKRIPAENAFTSLEGLLEIDYADLGDMESDAFVRKLMSASQAAH
ncbi:MAG: hypothetical protein ACREO0_00295 [Pseudoxanthomonas sp.]